MAPFDAPLKYPKKIKLHPLGTPAEGDFVERRNTMPQKEASDLPNQESRNEFHRDRDRILYSRAFRRMIHKTQVCFTGEMNEHLRTRLTHTLEVSQVARSIARAVGANEDLTEAIALGHDVGHTPFGHIGEQVLSDFLSDGDLKRETDDDQDNPSSGKVGFKHNYQSVRLLSELETGYFDYSGLNLTWLVLEGILKHSKLAYRERAVFYEDISDNIALYPKQEFSVTIEGQIVGLADEIAQVCHDYEDAFEVHFSNQDLMSAETYEALQNGGLKFLKDDCQDLNKIIDEVGRRILPEYYKQFSSYLIGHIIKTSISKAREKMDEYILEYPDPSDHFPLKEWIVSEKTILGDDPVFSFLRKMQEQYIIHAYEISRENQKGRFVLEKLIEAYVENPLQLPDIVLIWYSKRCSIRKVRDKIPSMPRGSPNIRYIEKNKFLELKELISQDGLFLRAICDYISTMTDRFAITEYQKLYGTSFGETS
jgi:dGTPase